MLSATLRLMTEDDLAAANRLREIAGWNQTQADWRRFLALEPEGCFVACVDGQVCGTVTNLNYENRVAWIGMILVDPAFRRHGIGKKLLDKGIEYLETKKVETTKLDATPMGHDLYLQRGFVDEYMIERWEGVAPGRPTESQDASQLSNPGGLEPDELKLVLEKDREVFGADRSALLHSIWQDARTFSAAAYCGNEVLGYILGRKGARATYLGPWVARDDLSMMAGSLFDGFLRRVPGAKVFVDVCLENPHARTIVQRAGFKFQRPLTRMYRGTNRHPGKPNLVCGIAGPELG